VVVWVAEYAAPGSGQCTRLWGSSPIVAAVAYFDRTRPQRLSSNVACASQRSIKQRSTLENQSRGGLMEADGWGDVLRFSQCT